MIKEKDFKNLYNEEDDILTIYDVKKFPSEFVEISDFMSLGLNKDGSFNSLEISDASSFLNSINKEVNKDFLKDLKLAKIKQSIFRGVFLLFLVLFSNEGKVIEQSLPPLFKFEYESPLIRTLKN